MQIVTILFLLVMSVFARSWAETDLIVPIDPECTASPEICQKRATQRAMRIKRCQEDPAWCEQYQQERQAQQEKRKQFCEKNPVVCEKRRQEREALREQCKAQPDKCKIFRQQYRKQTREVWCQANVEKCQQWKADRKQMRAQCAKLRQQLQEKYPDAPI